MKLKWLSIPALSLALSIVLSQGRMDFALAEDVKPAPAADPGVSRESLFTRAFHSLSFLLTMASLDKGFLDSLTESEKQTFQYIDTLTSDARNRQWLLEHGAQIFPVQGVWDTYYHVPYSNKPFRTHSPVRFQMRFSNNSELFQIDGTERAAMTQNELDRDIFVNLRRINTPEPADQTRTFSEVASLLVHEFGHKIPALGLQKDQSAINNLGAKLKSFLDSQINTFEVPGGRVHVLAFKKSYFKQWYEQTFVSPNPATGIRIIDNEGLIVFYENERGVFDLTDMVMKPISDRALVKGERPDVYTWANINWILADGAQVKNYAEGRISVELNIDHTQAAIAFLRAGAPDPQEAGFWKRFFGNTPPMVPSRRERIEAIIDVSGERPKIVREINRTLKFEDASVKVKKIGSEWQNDDLVAKYDFSAKLETNWEGGLLRLRPYLVVRLHGEITEIASTNRDSTSGVHEFRIPGIKSLADGHLDIIGMELEPTTPNLALTGEARLKVFMDKESVPLAGREPAPVSRLKQMLLWDGHNFSDLSAPHANRKNGKFLRLIFDSSSPLVSLKMLLTYNWNVHMVGPGLDNRQRQRATKWITIEPSDLRQTLHNGSLVVDVPIDANLDTEKTYNSLSSILARPDEVAYGKASLFKPNERVTATASAVRGIMAVEFVNQGLRTSLESFDKPLIYQSKGKDPTMPPTAPLTPTRSKTKPGTKSEICRDIFIR